MTTPFKERIIIASGNKGKLAEIQSQLNDFDIIPYFELIPKINIIEDGTTFEENAIKKAFAIYEQINDQLGKNEFILSEDSGLCVKALDNAPGIYSARFAQMFSQMMGVDNDSDDANTKALIKALKDKNLNKSEAYYHATICLIDAHKNYKCFTGQMQGCVITTPKGTNGFGYDPIFIPDDYNETLAQLPISTKEQISHRSKALNAMKKYIKLFDK